MGYNCCNVGARSFLTKEEKVEMLKEYEGELSKELEGVKERIKDLQKAN